MHHESGRHHAIRWRPSHLELERESWFKYSGFQKNVAWRKRPFMYSDFHLLGCILQKTLIAAYRTSLVCAFLSHHVSKYRCGLEMPLVGVWNHIRFPYSEILCILLYKFSELQSLSSFVAIEDLERNCNTGLRMPLRKFWMWKQIRHVHFFDGWISNSGRRGGAGWIKDLWSVRDLGWSPVLLVSSQEGVGSVLSPGDQELSTTEKL